MPVPQIVLASRTEQENQLLRTKLSRLEREFRPQFLSVQIRGLISSLERTPAAIIYNPTELGNREASDLLELRHLGYRGPILAISKSMPQKSQPALDKVQGLVYLERPYEPRDLEGIVRKMLRADEVAQRVFRRFETDENAVVEPFGKEAKYSGHVSNLSKGGAMVKLESSAPLSRGELVRVKFALAQVQRVYTLPARIVWARKQKTDLVELEGERLGVQSSIVGVEFIGRGEVQYGIGL